ncbi:MAG: ABC transporter permease [Candidatus Sulfotelmatobacter sp.]
MWIDRHDLLYTIRSARREPLLSIIAVVALSLGIGLNADVFTLLNAMFLTAPTQKNPASFVQLYPRYEGWFTGAGQFSSFTTEDYDAIRTRSTALEEAAAWQQSSAVLNQRQERIATLLVTCNYFHVFGIDRPLLGRLLAPDECDRSIAPQVVVLSEPFWKSQWESWYTTVNSTVQAAGRLMQVMLSINIGGSPASPDGSYATDEAAIAVSYSNPAGLYNGFGSQGLQSSDMVSFGTCPGIGAPTTSNNWGCMFTQYWSGGSTPTTVPLELQQVDCSDPNGYAPTGTNKCLQGTSGTGLTGDLRQVYPFATANHTSILELYHHDALLAFDPYYCVISSGTYTGSSDSFGSDLSTDAQINFFNAVGIDSSCNTLYGVPAPSSGTGGCQYAAAITAAHGPH